MFDFMQDVVKALKALPHPFEPGDSQAFILDDAVVLVRLTESRDMKVNVTLDPIRLEGVRTGLTDEEGEG